jgi:hypothetical protein
MGRRRRLKKSDGGELEINRQDLAALDETISLPSVAVSDEGGAEQNVAKHNVGTSNEATDDRSVVALDREIGEHNCALSQLKQKNSIGIDCFRIRGH